MKKIARLILPVLIISICWLSLQPAAMAWGEIADEGSPVAENNANSGGENSYNNENGENAHAENLALNFMRRLDMRLGSQEVTITDAEGTAETKTIETMPMLRNDRTLVPLRFICEEVLGCQVDYIKETDTVNLTRKDIAAVVDLHSKVVEVEYADGRSESPQMEQIPVLKNDYTYMPLRFFSELFGCRVDYKSEDQSITIFDFPTRTLLRWTDPLPR